MGLRRLVGPSALPRRVECGHQSVGCLPATADTGRTLDQPPLIIGRLGSPSCQPFGADEFVCRVAERARVEPQAVWTDVRAVLGTLEREVAEMEEVRQRLPRQFDALMA